MLGVKAPSSSSGLGTIGCVGTRQVKVARRGGDVVVAQPLLQAVEIDARFQQMRRVRVAQRVNAAALGDARVCTRGAVPALGRLDVQRLRRIMRRGKQPLARMCAAPPDAQHLQYVLRQRYVAILGALALLDPDAHAIGVTVDVGHP